MGEPFQWKIYEILDEKKKQYKKERQTNEEQIKTKREREEGQKRAKNWTPVMFKEINWIF